MLTLLALGACVNKFGYRAGDERIASVGDAELYRSDLAAAMPSGVVEADSVNYAKTFISKWIVEQLKQQEAEALFSDSEADIEKMVEEYRRSLLVRRLTISRLSHAVRSRIKILPSTTTQISQISA